MVLRNFGICCIWIGILDFDWVVCGCFFLGISGNLLVCLVVWWNWNFRILMNVYFVNLVVVDFMVIVVCLFFILFYDVLEFWFLGIVGCKIVIYL